MARRPDPLQQSIDRLAASFDSFANRIDSLENGMGGDSGGGDAVARHLRRFAPFYALLAIWILILGVITFRDDEPSTGDIASRVTDTSASSDTSTSSSSDTPVSTLPSTAVKAQSIVGGGDTTPSDVAGPQVAAAPQGLDPLAWNQTGKTAGNFDCKPGVRQIPWSLYMAPCVPKWSGTNPGATSRGVTSKEIIIVRRKFPETANSQAVDAVAAQAGAAPTDVTNAARLQFVKYFNKVSELWGRQVKFIEWESQFGDSTAEAQGVGKEGACADANIIVNDLKAFAVLDGGAAFSECAAERKLLVFNAASYYPENFYRKYHPYLWNGVMECERITRQLAEYVGKRLAHKPAKWAKNLQKDKPRKFAIYVPNNDAYQSCTDISEKIMKDQYGVTGNSRYNYVLDISRFPDEAAKAVVQFNADGATTIILACDPISPIFLTQSAKGQQYFPEWFEIGTALQDVDNVPRLWDAEEIRNSLWGLSQLGSTGKILGPDGEALRTYKAATGTKLAAGTDGGYFAIMGMYAVLQAAGPNLTPQTIADAFFRSPAGGAPRFEAGYVSYQDGPDGSKGTHDHTGIDDSREIWWDPTTKGYDGVMGQYIEVAAGKRYRNGDWPKTDPQVFVK